MAIIKRCKDVYLLKNPDNLFQEVKFVHLKPLNKSIENIIAVIQYKALTFDKGRHIRNILNKFGLRYFELQRMATILFRVSVAFFFLS